MDISMEAIVESLVEAAEAGNFVILIAPWSAEVKRIEEEEENPYEDFWNIPGETMNGGIDQDAILMDNPFQS